MPEEGTYISVEDYCEHTGDSIGIIKADIDARDRKGKLESGVHYIFVNTKTFSGEINLSSGIFIHIQVYSEYYNQSIDAIIEKIEAKEKAGIFENDNYWIRVDKQFLTYAEEPIREWKELNGRSPILNDPEERLSNMIVTTSMFVAGREIEREIDVITSECVYGMNVFRDIFAAVRDIVGGRSKASEKVLRDARKEAMKGLKEEAVKVGADAVIAIDLDYMEMGGGKSEMMVSIASGTAVKLKPTS